MVVSATDQWSAKMNLLQIELKWSQMKGAVNSITDMPFDLNFKTFFFFIFIYFGSY